MHKQMVLFGFTVYLNVTGSDGLSGMCVDLHGRSISPGFHFVPGPDTCTLCICDGGTPKWCKAVLCSPPQDCKSFRVGNSCCEFICLDDTLGSKDASHDDLGLRLIASAITAILSLSLLFFLIHRLRQRKIRGRETRDLSSEEHSIGYIAGSLGYLPDLRYEDPPGHRHHLALWKPPGDYFPPRGEAPPPYEEAVAAARAEAALATIVPGPSQTLHYTANHHRTIPLNVATSVVPLLAPPLPQLSLQPPIGPTPQLTQHQRGGCNGMPSQRPVAPTSITVMVGERRVPVGRGITVIPEVIDDYRVECENCNQESVQQEVGEEEYDDQGTMTLHRRLQAAGHVAAGSSLTLPTHPTLTQRTRTPSTVGLSGQAGARENWFRSMPESSTSSDNEEDEEEE